MAVQFLAKSSHIVDIVIGQSGKYQSGIQKTEMEKGAGKRRVTNPTPLFEISATLFCTEIGAAQVHSFYLNEGKQGAKWFEWDWLPNVEEGSLVRFDKEPTEQMIFNGKSGLYEMKITIHARERTRAIDQSLLDDVNAYIGSVADLHAVSGKIGDIDFQPEFDAWGDLV